MGWPVALTAYSKVLIIKTETGKKAAGKKGNDVVDVLLKISKDVKIPVIRCRMVTVTGAFVVNLIYRINRWVNEGELTLDTLVSICR